MHLPRMSYLLAISMTASFLVSQASDPYRSTRDLEKIFREQAINCPFAHPQWLSVKPTLLSAFLRHPPPGRLLMITISRHSKLKAPLQGPHRAPMRRPVLVAVFGEHPRERITSQLALEILMRYCRSPPIWIDFVLVPIANHRVDSGASCERLNNRFVDLNRNYIYNWGKTDDNTVREEEAPGQWPLCESETSAIDMLVQLLRPTAYVSVHSGDRAVLVPWDSGDAVGGWVYNVANSVREKHCQMCRIGSSRTLFGYRAYGTGVDHMFGVRKVPFACTLEIYGGPSDDCRLMFNPATDTAAAEVLRNWSSVLDTVGKEVNGTGETISPWYGPFIPRGYVVNIIEDGEVDGAERSMTAESALFVAIVSFLTIFLRIGLQCTRRIKRPGQFPRRLARGRLIGLGVMGN